MGEDASTEGSTSGEPGILQIPLLVEDDARPVARLDFSCRADHGAVGSVADSRAPGPFEIPAVDLVFVQGLSYRL